MTDAAHNRNLVVWDVPPAVRCGETFVLRAGLKCDANCRPRDWALEIRDHDGTELATALVANEAWPGTTALYFAEFEMEAPDTVGQFKWRVFAAAVGSNPSPAADRAPATPNKESADSRPAAVEHAETSVDFNLRTVPQADCRLTVVAIDREAQAPVSGLKVVVHPYRAMTDQSGVAELELPKGKYRLFVSGKNFFPYRIDTELTEDLTIRAELDVDRGPSDAELWS